VDETRQYVSSKIKEQQHDNFTETPDQKPALYDILIKINES